MGLGDTGVQLSGSGDWAGGPATWARGRAFLGGELLDAAALARMFEAAADPTALADLARSLTGHFAVMGRGPAGPFAVVDRSRSFPVFFSADGGKLLLSDSPYELPGSDSVPAPRDALVDFAYAGYVTGDATLLGGVREVPAASILTHAADGSVLATYDAYEPTRHGVLGEADDVLLEMAHSALAEAIGRLVTVLDGRTLVLPLSAGYDSRLLAMMVKLSGYDRVQCFSYGVLGNHESRVSESVAEALGFEWHFIEYGAQQWAEWTRSEAWSDYARMAHLGVALPLMQGWPSAGEIRRRQLVPDDSVFCPGLFGDVGAGLFARGDLLREVPPTRLDVAETIVASAHSLWWTEPARSRDLRGVAERIAASLASDEFATTEAAAAAFESWIWRERQAKFIGNATRVYEYWGYDWWLPFGDEAVFSFWQQVPYSRRVDKPLYGRLVLESIPDRLGAPRDSILRQPKSSDRSARRLARALDKTGLLRAARNRLRSQPTPETVYESHPLAWWGAVDRDVFLSRYTGKETVYSFMTDELLARQYGWVRGTE